MRIAHVVGEAGGRAGGAELYALDLAHAQQARGDDVTVVHVYGGIAGGTLTARHAPTPQAMTAALRELDPDVVHVHGTPLPAESEPVGAGLPVVRSLHDYTFGCASGEHWFRGGAACTRAHGASCVEGILVRGCAHRTDVRPALRALPAVSKRLSALRGANVVVYSRHMQQVATANRIDPARISTLHYFVERADRPAPPAPGRSFAYVGRIVDAKGLDVALQALARCASAWDEFHVVGDGWARPSAERLAAKLGLGDRVVFHGWLDRRAAAGIVTRSTALLVPSRWPEPVGIVGLEAGALGRPAIGSQTGGIPEWLRHEETGLLVRPGDADGLAKAVTRLAGDSVLAARLGQGGWAAAAGYALAPHLAALDAVYGKTAERAAA